MRERNFRGLPEWNLVVLAESGNTEKYWRVPRKNFQPTILKFEPLEAGAALNPSLSKDWRTTGQFLRSWEDDVLRSYISTNTSLQARRRHEGKEKEYGLVTRCAAE
jgi:hypothetical protein